MSEKASFDPSKYLSKVGRADYLEVKWRLVWLREVDPQAVIETEHIRIDDLAAIFKARVTLSTGGSATGYGNVTANEFPDYIGKCETVALGRALAALGFGTQFAEVDEGARIVDAQVARPAAAVHPAPKPPLVEPSDKPTVGKLKYLAQEANAAGLSPEDVEARALLAYQHELSELTIAEYEELVQWVKAKRGEAVGVR